MESGYSVTHLVKREGVTIGFFTLVTDSLQRERVDESEFHDCQYGKFPAMKIARLATHKDFERQGVGQFMINKALTYGYYITRDIGCCVITVDAKKGSVGFYEKFSFVRAKTKSDSDTITMYFNLAQAIKNAFARQNLK